MEIMDSVDNQDGRGPGENALVRLSGFSKRYGQTVAVDHLDFAVFPGMILGLVGPNGAGKTTTLRTLTGIIPPSEGAVEIAGHDLLKDPVAAKMNLAYVPDDPRLFESLTVWEHIQFTAASYRVKDYAKRGTHLLDQFVLTEKRNAMCSDLSRGMRQKVAICCALLYQPKVVLLDEPLTGLDPRGIVLIKETVRQIAAAGGAVILSSHLLSLVEDLCDHLLILHRGKSRFFGPLAELRPTLDQGQNRSLEEIFLQLTDETPPPLPTTHSPEPREGL